jgi:AraC-like DNA-binding protein
MRLIEPGARLDARFAFLRLGAHAELRAAEPEPDPVAAVARRWGFPRTDLFVLQYRAHFPEDPGPGRRL